MTLKQHSPGRDLRVRYAYVGAAMLLGLLLLAVRLYRLQIALGEVYAQKSVANFVKPTPILADRGMILDRNGAILVDNRPSFDAFVTPAFCDKCAELVLPQVGALLHMDVEELDRVTALVKAKSRGPEKFQRLPIRIDLTRDEMDILNAHLLELDGVEVQPVPHRSYRAGNVLAHVLGYMNEITQDELEQKVQAGQVYLLGDYIGRRGLERSFETKLRGVDGVRKEVVNARGQVLPELSKWVGAETPPEPGSNLVLSIDYRLQEAAEQAFPGVAGSVVVVDVRTGFILAVVSRPAFDPNVLTGRVTPQKMAELSQDPLQPMIFRASQNHYSPGSTFKVVTALAAMQSGQFTPRSSVTCTGGYSLGARRWRCHKDSGHGPVDLKHAMMYSCDTWFYRVADSLGLDPIARVGRELGLGSPTGIGGVAEIPGIMPDEAYHQRVTPGGYTKGMALNSAIGQGDDNVTPLQLAMLYAAIANGGTLYQPQLVRRVESVDGKLLEDFPPKAVRQVAMTPEQRNVLVDALSAVVNEPGGTAYREHLPDVLVAGKTGTAQVRTLGAQRLKKEQMEYWARDHAWFASFAPAGDPEIAVVVLNEHGGHGGSDAAPTAMAVVKRYMELKNQPPPPKEPVSPVQLTLPPPPPPRAAARPPPLTVGRRPNSPAPEVPLAAGN